MKSKLSSIFLLLLWVVIGAAVWQTNQSWQTLQTAALADNGKVNIQSLLNNISHTVRNTSIMQDKYQRFEEIEYLLQNEYYFPEDVDTEQMLESAVKSFVDGLWDPYTVYFDYEENTQFFDDLDGEMNLEGIGAVISKKEYYILIEEVIKQSPAMQAWILPLDRIVAIQWSGVEDMNVTQAVEQIRWPAGTQAILTVERDINGQKELLDIQVTREKITIPSVSHEIYTTNNKKLWYINISMIWEETEKMLKKSITELKAENIQGVILDLRWNGGWFLPIAIEISSHFIPKDTLIATAKYKTYATEEYYSLWYESFEWLPVVILIDIFTASAGEIIAGALQEQVNATLIGTQTFGKWSIQTLVEFTDGAALKYTVGRRYLPSGKNIDKNWLEPNIIIEFDTEQYADKRIDNQLKEAINILSNTP